MLGRLALLCALALLVVASARTEPLKVSEAQQIPNTATPTLTPTGTPTQTRTPTLSPTPSLSTTPTASTTATGSTTPSTSPTSSATATLTITPTRIPAWTMTPTATRTPTRTVTVTPTSTTGAMPTQTAILRATAMGTASAASTPVAPVIMSVSTSNLTRSGATVMWTTNVPADAQIEYGVGPSDVNRSSRDASLVTSHRQILTGLQPGATYHFRVRSASAGGGLAISNEATFVTQPAGSGPEIGSVGARLITGTTATIGWATASGTVAQVEYGPTANYNAFTLLKVFAGPYQETVLTGLRPATEYHYRINSWDGSGYLAASGDLSFTTAFNGQATLLGDQTIQSQQVSLLAGQAAAYQFVAGQSGQASVVRLFIDGGTTATVVRVGLYSDVNGSPGAVLTQSSAPGLISGWSAIALPPVAVVQGTRYWIVVLSPVGGGVLNLRDAGLGGSSLLSQQNMLAALPAVWSTGTIAARSPLSAYVQQVPPAVTLMSPSEGTVVTGKTVLSAVVDDDVAVSRVQFLVDGLPVGAPSLAPPYVMTWDSTGLNASQPHTISARASDAQGRSGVSGLVTVQVDNGPTISNVVMSRGLTATSAHVTWSTDLLADGQVEYGASSGYGLSTPVDSRMAWAHEAQITGLVPGSAYHYRVRSRDANGALAVSADGTFFTPEPSV